MTSVLFILVMAVGAPVFASGLCQRNYAAEDREAPGRVDLRGVCELGWVDGKAQKVLQVVPIKKGCARFEGTPIGDCAWVRICAENPRDRLTGAPLHLDEQTKRELCDVKGASMNLLGADLAAQGVHARASCAEGRLQVEMAVRGATKTCLLSR